MRPLALLAAGFLGGAFLAASVAAPRPAAVGLAVLALGVLRVLVGSRRRTGSSRLGADQGLVGLRAVSRAGGRADVRAARAWTCAIVLAALSAGWVAGRPRVATVPEAGVYRTVAVVERSAHGRHPWARLRVVAGVPEDPTSPSIRAGTTLLLRGRAPPAGAEVRGPLEIRPERPYRNPTPHPPWPGMAQGSSTARAAGALDVDVDPVLRVLASARDAVRTALTQTLAPRAAGIARALVLGEGSAVASSDREAVRDAGLAHVLAVSGLHVAIVAGLWVALARTTLLRIPRLARRLDVGRLAFASGILFALSFAAFAGGAPSAWRAAVTASIAWGLRASGRRPQTVPVAAAAALFLGALDPTSIVRPGFMLSVVATAAVLSVRAPAERTARAWLLTAFSISWRTTVATAPVVLWCFGSVPVVGVLANVLLVPVGSLVLVPLAVLHALAATATPSLSPLTAAPFEAAAAAFVAACRGFTELVPRAEWPPPSIAQGLVLAAACIAVLAAKNVRARLVVAACALALLAAGEWHLHHTERPHDLLRATFLDVGQGDAALLDLPDGRLLVVDGGGVHGESRDPGRRVLLPLLAARRRSRIHAAVISHPHPDHYRGLAAVLAAVPTEELWDNGQASAEHAGGPVTRLLARARHRGTSIVTPADLCDRPRSFGRARLEVLWPCYGSPPGYDAGFEPNDNSFVLRITLGRRRLLLTGDIEAGAEAELLARGTDVSADVLKIPHHGSRTSSTAAFLDAVAPTVAIISAGTGNRFGHPRPEVLQRLRARDTHVVRLDESGGTVVETDGDWLRVEAWDGELWTDAGASPSTVGNRSDTGEDSASLGAANRRGMLLAF